MSLELLHQRLGHISTISLLAGDTSNDWEDIELRIDSEPFFTSCQISSMNKKARSNIPLKQKITLQVGFYGYNSINIAQKFDK